MVKIRLRRKGRIHKPFYDIVAVDARKRRDGAYLERLGYYNPHTHPSTIVVDPDRTLYWLNVGAQPSEIVQKLLSYQGILLRKHLAIKNTPQPEIEEAVENHIKTVKSRYLRRKELRKKRVEMKTKAAEQAEKAEAETKAQLAAE